MSATGRNRKGKERRDKDFYPTPRWCTHALMARVPFGRTILDPAAGDGAILDVVAEWELEKGGRFNRLGIELDRLRAENARASGHTILNDDALSVTWPWCDAVVTNPPYSLASEFVSRFISQMTDSDTGALTCKGAFLLPLSFLGSDGRASFHRGFPSNVYVLPRRPSFTGDGQTDSEVYAWFVWEGAQGPGSWEILEEDS
jgi:hypothetical protein